MDLTAAQWRLTVEFGKLIFSAWNSGRSFSRRVEGLAYRDRDRFGIFVRKPGGRETTTLEFRELRAPRGRGPRRRPHGVPPATHRPAGARISRVEIRTRQQPFRPRALFFGLVHPRDGDARPFRLGVPGIERRGRDRRRRQRAGLRPHLAGLAAEPGRPRGDYAIETVSAARCRQRDCPSSCVSQPPRLECGDL